MVEFEKKLSLGTALLAATQLVAAVGFLGSGVLSNRDRLRDLESEMSAEKQARTEVSARISNLETNTTAALGALQNLLTNLRVEAAHGSGARK